jgi:hypothetical protein
MSGSETNTARSESNRHATMDRAAGHLAVAGATLGVIAGLVDVAIGASIRAWVGNKLDTTTLGVATVILSGVSLAAGVEWHRPGGRAAGRRLATVLGLLVPAGVCFTTSGRLWFVPGVLLLSASVLVLLASSREELVRAVDEHRWLNGLVALLGGYYVFLGADALPQGAGVLGILGGLAIWTALLATRRSHRAGLGLLWAGALPFAILTWWSVITPLIAILILTIGPAAARVRRAIPDAT